MKKTRRNLKKRMLFVGFFVTLFLFFVGTSAHAVVLESGIPGVGGGGAQGQKLPSLPTYINYLYIFVLSFVGIAGFISLVIWGTVWVASAVVDKKARAMEGIKNTLIGIGIALTAFIMLNTINPDLTLIKIPGITKVVVPKAPAPSPVVTGAAGSQSDGASCANSIQCYPGSTCAGIIKNPEAGVVTTLGKCTRITDSSWEGFCAKNDASSVSCVGIAGCKYCAMPDNSTRCINKNTSYNKCTE